MLIVSKFGGTSMATADSIRLVADILSANPARKICVVSAPGRTHGCIKMTDLLVHDYIQVCAERTVMLVNGLGLTSRTANVALSQLFHLEERGSVEARLSYGEWLSAYLLSVITDRRMVDACDVVFFEGNQVSIKTPWQPYESVIIPGFYGHDVVTGNIRTFPRGGSDITASLIAAEIGATLCENWTDVPGVFNKDPNRYQDAVAYTHLSYQKLRIVAQGGAQVFHPEAIAPLAAAGIPLQIKSTFASHIPGTRVT